MNKFSSLEKYFDLRSIIFLSAIFFLIRVGFVLIYSPSFHSVEDFRIAENLAKGIGYINNPAIGLTAMKAPVYPLYLTMFITLFGESAKFIIVIIQHFLMSCVPVLLFLIGKKLEKKNIFFIAGILFCLHPSYFYYPNVIEATNLTVPLVLLVCLFIVYFIIHRPEQKAGTEYIYYSVLGILAGIIILTQPVFLPILIAIFIHLIYKKKTKFVVVSALLLILTLTPWTIRNYSVFHKIIPTKSVFWMNFYGSMRDESVFNDKYPDTKNRIDSLETRINDVELEKHYKSAFFTFVSENPIEYIQIVGKNIVRYWWVPARYKSNYSAGLFIIRVIPVLILNVLTLVGLYYLWKRRKNYAITVILVLLYFTLVYGLTHSSNIRFKLDIEWLQLLPVAFWLEHVFNKVFKVKT